MGKRIGGAVSILAGVGSLAVAAWILFAMLDNGSDFGGKSLAKITGVMGLVLVSTGVSLLRGKPLAANGVVVRTAASAPATAERFNLDASTLAQRPLDAQFGRLLTKRGGGVIVPVAIGALALTLLIPAIGIYEREPTTAIVFGASVLLLGFTAFRMLRSGLWFFERGLRQRGFLSTYECDFREVTEFSAEDVVSDYQGHHHSVVLRFNARGKPRRVVLGGKLGASLAEKRDPEADAIVGLFQGGGGR
jgi:hypothetical protein